MDANGLFSDDDNDGNYHVCWLVGKKMVEEQNGERSMSYPLRFGCNFLVGQNTEKQDVRFKMILQKVFKYTL